MRRTSFNTGWRVRPKPEMVAELLGGAAPWSAVRLPHDAMITQPRDPDGSPSAGYFVGGIWQYEKTFVVPLDDRGKRIVVEFEGVYRGAAVYVNGVLAGHRPYGYSNFFVRLDQLVRFGEENQIRVEATARDDARWYSGAGIYRDSTLIVGHPVHLALDGVRVTTPEATEEFAMIEVATEVENDTGLPVTTTLVTEVVDALGAVVGRDEVPLTAVAGRTDWVRQHLSLEHPRRWSVEDPNLYTCRSTLRIDGSDVDTESVAFGIRSLTVDAVRGLRINGASVKLRGACIHHDNGVIGAATIRRADERRIELLKAAGFNAVRSAHNPMGKAMLDACDRLGMLVMDEAFDMWTEAKTHDDYSRSFPDWWRADVEAMVVKDFNHPSVIMYSIGNEIPETGHPGGAALSRSMAEAIRALDHTRPVTNGINPVLSLSRELFAAVASGAENTVGEESGVNTVMTQMNDYLPLLLQQEVVGLKLAESYSALDVAGYNYTESRYEMDHQMFPNRVIVGTETNSTNIDRRWRLVEDNSHVIGDFVWTGWDYLGEAGIGRVEYDGAGEGFSLFGSYPWLLASTGDIDITGFRRPISYFRETVFGLRTAPFIAVQPPQHHGRQPSASSPWSSAEVASWSWPGFEGAPIDVAVYSDADEVALSVNGREVGRRPAGPSAGYRAEFETTFEPGAVVAAAYRGTEEVARATLWTPTGPVQLDVEADRERIRADDTDLAFVTVTLVDDDGNVHNGVDRSVTITLDGPGELLGLGSANPRTEEGFGSPVHTTFGGRALAVVRPHDVGRITLTVSAEDCEDRSVIIEAELSGTAPPGR